VREIKNINTKVKGENWEKVEREEKAKRCAGFMRH